MKLEANMAGYIIGLAVSGITAVIMVAIGISNLKSSSPVGFYTGEEPFKKEELSDWKTWNKKHGWMWIFYGIFIVLGYGLGELGKNDIWFLVFELGSIIVPLPFMCWYHHRLIIKNHKK